MLIWYKSKANEVESSRSCRRRSRIFSIHLSTWKLIVSQYGVGSTYKINRAKDNIWIAKNVKSLIFVSCSTLYTTGRGKAGKMAYAYGDKVEEAEKAGKAEPDDSCRHVSIAGVYTFCFTDTRY